MALSDNLALLLRIKGDNSEGLRALSQTETAVKGLSGVAGAASSGSLSGLVGSLAKMAGGLSTTQIACLGTVATFTALGAAAYGVTKALFSLAEDAAKFGSEIYDASVQTGLGAEMLSTLKAEAEMADVEFSKITTSINKFSLLIAKAKDGNEEAIKSLNKLGINGAAAFKDVEAATSAVVKKIYETENPIAKADLAARAFGTRGGKDMLKVIDQMKGDLPGAVAEMKNMGLTISNDAMRGADEFDDSLKMMNMQFQAMKRTIGVALMPVFTQAMQSMSRWFAENKGGVQQLATKVGSAVSSMLQGLIKLFNWVMEHKTLFLVLLGAATGGMMGGPWGSVIGIFFGTALSAYLGSGSADPQQKGIDLAKSGKTFDEVVAAVGKDVEGQLQQNFGPPNKERIRYAYNQWLGRIIDETRKVAKEKKDIEELQKSDDVMGTNSVPGTGKSRNRDSGFVEAAIRNLRAEIEKYANARDRVLEAFSKRLEKTQVKDNVFRTPTAEDIDKAASDATLQLTRVFNIIAEDRKKILAAEMAKIDADKEKSRKVKLLEKGALQQEFDNESERILNDQTKQIEQIEKEASAKKFKVREEASQRYLKQVDDENAMAEEKLKRSYENREMTEKEFIQRSADLKTKRIVEEKKELQNLLDNKDIPFEEIQKLRDRIAELERERLLLATQTNGAIIAADAATAKEREQIWRETQDIINQMRVDALEADVEAKRRKVDTSVNKKGPAGELLLAEMALAAKRHEIRNKELADAKKDALTKKGITQAEIDDIEFKYKTMQDAEDDAFNRTRKRISDSVAELTMSPWEKWAKNVRDNVANVGSSFANLSNMMFDSFQKMGQALETAIGRWILYGESIGKAMKKALAEELATIAARAAMWALYSTAFGFFELARGNKKEAKDAFTAAAIYSAVAVAAGAGARALAKSAFADESNKASGKSQTSRTSGTQGQAYSGKEGTSIDAGRPGVGAFKPELVIKDKSGMFSQLFEAEIRNNSKVRSLIIQTANS